MAALAVVAFFASACGDDDDSADDEAADDSGDDSGAANACPEDGCVIEITEVEADGDELVITWSTNFGPDLARNHIHVYWDTFTAEQVSDNAEAEGFEQGDWVPTDIAPTFTTEGAVSVSARGESTTVCVTAADRDHVVIDTSLVDCRDVSDLL